MSFSLLRSSLSSRARAALGRRAHSSSGGVDWHVNTHLTATPISHFSARNPTLFKILAGGILGFGYCIPFVAMSFQLNKQGKHLYWYDKSEVECEPEEDESDD